MTESIHSKHTNDTGKDESLILPPELVTYHEEDIIIDMPEDDVLPPKATVKKVSFWLEETADSSVVSEQTPEPAPEPKKSFFSSFTTSFAGLFSNKNSSDSSPTFGPLKKKQPTMSTWLETFTSLIPEVLKPKPKKPKTQPEHPYSSNYSNSSSNTVSDFTPPPLPPRVRPDSYNSQTDLPPALPPRTRHSNSRSSLMSNDSVSSHSTMVSDPSVCSLCDGDRVFEYRVCISCNGSGKATKKVKSDNTASNSIFYSIKTWFSKSTHKESKLATQTRTIPPLTTSRSTDTIVEIPRRTLDPGCASEWAVRSENLAPFVPPKTHLSFESSKLEALFLDFDRGSEIAFTDIVRRVDSIRV
ncbi:hypothetical protein BC833DRAFT_594914 [Globomyces pollinis-pini]|nr:hypothetical protein BC833DRAFT_594914 [Globomyces pollinis-pini]KAJ2996920.1 hypothetical protein HDV02_006012 [Globomyces sp. JEL0801]